MSFQSHGQVSWHHEIETLYFHFHKTYKHQTRHSGYLCWGVGFHWFSHISLSSFGQTMSRDKIKKGFISISTRPISTKLSAVVPYDEGLPLIMSCYKIKTLYLLFHKTNKNHLWHNGYWARGVHPQNHMILNHMVTWYHVRITIWLQDHVAYKIQIKFRIFILYDNEIWLVTYSKTWCYQIMLSTPQKVSASNSCLK